MSERTLRILQASDFHLSAAPPRGLPEEVAEQVRLAVVESFRRFCRLGREEAVDALLVPGDLFERERAEDVVVAEALRAVRECELPVLVTPGNHDYWSEASFWTPRRLRSRGLSFPANLHVFTEDRFATLDLPGAEERATVTGICYRRHEAPGGLDAVPPEDDRIHLLAFHGSLGGTGFEQEKAVLPFERDELLALGFDWAAVGHYHGAIEIRDDDETPRAAYSGIPQPRRWGETGGKQTSALLVEIRKDARASRVELERRPLAAHRFLTLEVDVGGIEAPSEATDRVEKALQEAGASADDLVRVELRGLVPPGITPEDLAVPPEQKVLHLELRTGEVRPDYELEAEAAEEEVHTVEGAFRRRMRERHAEALEREDEEEAERIRRAFAYGMDALRRGEVVPRHVV